MCIIVAKPKNVEMPSIETIENCFRRNPDGAGLMYVKDNQVIVDKGYMDIDSLLERLEKLKNELGVEDLKEKAVVLHFRIGTAGKNDRETTHPFIITNDFDKLRATKITSSVGMVHNGVISHYSYSKQTLSDTQLFIKHVVYPISRLDKKFYEKQEILDMLQDLAGSKLCFLDNKENIRYVGDKIEDNGIIYSNSTYKVYEYKYPIEKWKESKGKKSNPVDKGWFDKEYLDNPYYNSYYDGVVDGYDGYYLDDVRNFVMKIFDGDYISFDNGNTFSGNKGIKYLDAWGYLYKVDDSGFLDLISMDCTVYNRDYEEIEFQYGG